MRARESERAYGLMRGKGRPVKVSTKTHKLPKQLESGFFIKIQLELSGDNDNREANPVTIHSFKSIHCRVTLPFGKQTKGWGHW